MSTTHSKRTVLLVGVVTAMAIAAAGCSSSTGPGPASTTSSMAMDTNGAAGPINRADPTAVATSFATYFAAGDTPTACKLASPDGIKQITGNWGQQPCTTRQQWTTTATLETRCIDVVDKAHRDYVFKSASEFDSFSAFDLTLGQVNGVWTVMSVGKLDLAQPDQQPCRTS